MKPIADEYLVVVGAPTNMFNGYTFETATDVFPVPPPTSIADIDRYIHGTPGQLHSTHDRFWANFAYSAVLLIESGRVRPKPGDILTFAAFWPGYELRDQNDYEASPYNPLNRASPWVLNNFPYNPAVRGAEKGAGVNSNPRITKTRATSLPPPPPTDRQINHDILMRDVDDRTFNGGFSKYATRPRHFVDLMQNIPLRIAFGLPGIGFFEAPPGLKAPPLKQVMVKLLLVREVSELLSYISVGSWTGNYWTHPLDLIDESSAGTDVTNASWFATINPRTASHPDWAATPAVDRDRVKFKRLDYFGHSSREAFFLLYGTRNNKGELPVADVVFDKNDITVTFPPDVFRPDGVAKLWGCSLAERPLAGETDSFAKILAPHTSETKASEGLISYEHILDPPAGHLPVPSEAGFPFIVVAP